MAPTDKGTPRAERDTEDLVGQAVAKVAAQEGPKVLDFQTIMAAQDLPEDWVDVPEWGGRVKVKAVTKAQQRDIRKAALVTDAQGEEDHDEVLLQVGLLEAGLVEPKLTRDQALGLLEKNAGVVDRLVVVIGRLSGVDRAAVDAAMARFRPGPG